MLTTSLQRLALALSCSSDGCHFWHIDSIDDGDRFLQNISVSENTVSVLEKEHTDSV